MIKKCGIYAIINKANNRRYIGSSSNLKQRIWGHMSALRLKQHENNYLQKAWNKYKEEGFLFIILFYCDIDQLLFYEQKTIDYYRNNDGVYNLRLIASGNNGYKWTEESRKKQSISSTGRKMSPEAILKRTESRKGYRHSPKTRERMRDSATGFKHTDESIQKMSEIKLGKPSPRKGVKCTEEQIRRNSQIQKELWKDKEFREMQKKNLDQTGRTPWNKGLTKDSDERVRRYAKTLRNKKKPVRIPYE